AFCLNGIFNKDLFVSKISTMPFLINSSIYLPGVFLGDGILWLPNLFRLLTSPHHLQAGKW
ncbi:MAG: hypothetical protein KAI84_06260, partial [Gammaproteobacteria bacterium]|nr:hypothetical protein [Gammaproteobacteria bacterium]